MDREFHCRVQIDFDNGLYVKKFREKAEENGFDFSLVRLYEASLFLSMLPLHMDYPHKAMGFLLRALDILEELENG